MVLTADGLQVCYETKESKLNENLAMVMEFYDATYVGTYNAEHVINGSGFFFFIKLAIIIIKDILVIKVGIFCSNS